MWCISICEHWFIQINVRIFASYVTFVHFIYIHKWTRKIKHMTVSNQQDILLTRCFHSLNRYVIYSLIFGLIWISGYLICMIDKQRWQTGEGVIANIITTHELNHIMDSALRNTLFGTLFQKRQLACHDMTLTL